MVGLAALKLNYNWRYLERKAKPSIFVEISEYLKFVLYTLR